jgi:predicted HicB family RNase H-like nuclease
MPSVRRVAEDFSLKEGVSLNQFINVAVAEKIVHLQAGGPLINPEELL